MNKAELVDIVAADAGTTKKDAEQIINKMMDTIIKTVAGGDKVTLVGFGTFEARHRKARLGRNPKTMKNYNIPWYFFDIKGKGILNIIIKNIAFRIFLVTLYMIFDCIS